MTHVSPKGLEPSLTSLSHGGGCGCKISPAMLSEILKSSPVFGTHADVLVGRETSDDAAVYRIDDNTAIIATIDFFMPVVDDPHDFGAIAATNAISDVYAMGGRPIFAMAVVGMPVDKLSTEVIGRILAGGSETCNRAGIPVVGGHSIDSAEPIYGLAVLGLIHPERIKTNAGARAGDALILTKPLGVGVLSAALKRGMLDEAGYRQLVATTTRLNTAGQKLAELDGVHAMTDVTGFGLAGHGWEMARSAGLELQIDWHTVPLLPGVVEIAARSIFTGASGRNWASYGENIRLAGAAAPAIQNLVTDPQTSGGLLISCGPEIADAVLELLIEDGFVEAARIGCVVDVGRAGVTFF